MYVDTLNYYISLFTKNKTYQEIIFVENSGWDLNRFREKIHESNFISVEYQSLDPSIFNQTKGIIGEFTVEKRNEMFINNLFVTSSNRRNNLGTQILNFIKILSKQNGLGGKMRVLASLLGNETKNPPHIFYRKYGFTSDDKKALTEIDKHIKNKHQLPSSFKPMFMYYIPPKV